MALDRDTVLAGIPTELDRFHDLVASLAADDLATETRCAKWTVRDVAAHVIGTIVDVSEGRFQGQGTPAVTQRQVDERAGYSGPQLADELAQSIPRLMELLRGIPTELWSSPAPNDPTYQLGFAVEAIWYDAYVHADDILAALGRPPDRGAGLVCAVHHVAGYLEHQDWGPATLRLSGIGAIQISGGGPEITCDPHDFLLAATGRSDPSNLGLDPSLNVYAHA
jgi:uncharacterized protein (TIGR03083 family)